MNAMNTPYTRSFPFSLNQFPSPTQVAPNIPVEEGTPAEVEHAEEESALAQ